MVYGAIDKTENLVIPSTFEMAYRFSEEIDPMQQGGKWGFIDKMGKMVIPPQFDQVDSFYEELAACAVRK